MIRDLVLLHGWGFTRHVWAPVLPVLSRAFRVCNLDLPGCGEACSVEDADRSGQAVLDQWTDRLVADAPAGAVWMGWSLGAMVVLNTMQRAAGAVEAAVLVAATPKFVRDDRWNAGMAPGVFQEFSDGIRKDAAGALKRFVLLQAGGADRPRELGRAMSTSLVRPGAGTGALEAGLRVLREADLRPGLDALAAPVLVIHGSGDRVVPPDAGAYLAARLPRAALATLDTGHAPFAACPQAFSETVLSWT